MKTFSIHITTYNRLEELKITLSKLKHIIERDDVEVMVCDDASTDQTSQYVKDNYPEIQLISHTTNKGYIYNRNLMLKTTKALYTISLDDDAHFLTTNNLETIASYFENDPSIGVLAFRIFWSKETPFSTDTKELDTRVKGYVGCGHAWNMKAWNNTPNYPEWFVFYGEEDFASFQLFKNKWKIYYTPSILVHHRVNVKHRKNERDYQIRLRRSLRSGWYLYLLFYPISKIPKKMAYTLYIQIKTKVLKGDMKAFLAILQVLGDIMINISLIIKQANRLSNNEYKKYMKLIDTKLYWNQEEESSRK